MKKILLLLTFYIIITTVEKIKAQPILWGATSEGGQHNTGTLFNIDLNLNNHTVKHSFLFHDGMNPRTPVLCLASNGNFYGTTYGDGLGNKGVVFEYDPITGKYAKKIDFNGFGNGAYPCSSLIKAANGKLYGMTTWGGANDFGTIFEYDPSTNVLFNKVDFNGYLNGKYPFGSLMLANNGKLYGMTKDGGVNTYGVLFEYDPNTNIYTKKFDFDGALKGEQPQGDLMQANNGKLYGMTSFGGSNSAGVIFEYDISTNTLIKKFDFNYNLGNCPLGNLMQASNGKFYGMTWLGGNNNYGVLFEYDNITNTYTKKIDFNGNSNGKQPYANNLIEVNGKLYGTTAEGGINTAGVLFEYDFTTNTYVKKYDFDFTNGERPVGFQLYNGKFIGLTSRGGNGGGGVGTGDGVLYEYDIATNTIAKKIDFNLAYDGKNPHWGLMQSNNGMLYGTTFNGGNNDQGALFEYNPSINTYNKKYDFSTFVSGRPRGPIIQATNGKIYGIAGIGVNAAGELYEYDKLTGIYTSLINLGTISMSNNDEDAFILQANNGKLYGVTYRGGNFGAGTLFEYDINSATYIVKVHFNNLGPTKVNGYIPIGLMQASNGKLYGVTYGGGINDTGVLFEYDPTTSTYTRKIDFIVTTGHRSWNLIENSNGKLYGMTTWGGIAVGSVSGGVLFEYDPATNIYTKKIDFDGTNKGANPKGSLLKASNGKIYGMTTKGGTSDKGVIFEYDHLTNTLTKILDFNGANGANPYSYLVEPSGLIGINENNHKGFLRVYPNPSKGLFNFSNMHKESIIEIYDITGRIVYHQRMNENNYKIDLSGNNKGIYFYRVMNKNNEVQQGKLILQ